jgi:hypothetical protein
MKTVFFDVETRGLNANKVFLITFSEWSENRIRAFQDRDNFIKYLNDLNDDVILIAHNGFSFDFISIFDNYIEDKIINSDGEVLKNKSKIIFVKFKLENKKTINLIDTINLLPMSLEKIGNVLNFEKLNKTINVEKFTDKNYVNENFDLILKYCIRDTEILKKAVKTFFPDIQDLKYYSIAGFTFKNFKNHLKEVYNLKPYHFLKVNKELNDFCRKAYFGGRVEAFKLGDFKNINYYDINSLYPYVMTFEYPDWKSYKHYTEKTHSQDILLKAIRKNDYWENQPLFIVNATVKIPDESFTILPIRLKEKVVFPVGTITGTWTSAEFNAWNFNIIQIHDVYVFNKSFHLFKHFIENAYNERLKFKKQGNPLELIKKLEMNSLYGKFGFVKHNDIIVNEKDLNATKDGLFYKNKKIDLKGKNYGDYFFISEKEEYAYYTNFLIASFITSYARVELLNLINTAGKENVIYIDTDAIFTTQNLKGAGDELGGFKLEERFKNLKIHGLKLYDFENDKNEWIGKHKGIRGKKAILNNSEFDDERIVKPYTAIKRKLKAGDTVKIKINLKREYTKGTVDSKGVVKPLKF